MRLFRKLLILATSIVLGAAFVACGASGGNDDSSSSLPAESPSSEAVSSEEISSEDVSSEEVSSEEVSSEDVSSEEESSEEVSSEEESSEEVSSEEESSEEESSAIVHVHQYKTFVAEEATCIADGVRVYNCDCGAHYSEVIPQTTEHSYNTWVLISAADCANAGSKKLVCDYHPDEVKETVEIATKPHDYTFANGTCSCGAGPVFPEAPETITYISSDELSGDGTEYKRFQATEGYYTLTSGSRTKATKWFAFAISSPGQYALYTISGADKATITHYDASEQYITEASATDATKLSDGTLYSVVTCTEAYYSEQWRATFKIVLEKNSTVTFRFVKISEPNWTPSYTQEMVEAKQLNGNYAPESKADYEALEVPYDAQYFYDETCGYYRMGTKDTPGEIIYVAITAPATRMFGEMSFEYVNGTGDNLLISDGHDVEGNYFARNYANFIMEGYANYCNSDGLYPVNKELQLFLTRYVGKNTPIAGPDEKYSENKWLAACYYYANIPEGTQQNPIDITEPGAFTATVPEYDYVYYSLRYDDPDNESGITYCIISSTDENAYAKINGISYEGVFSVEVESSVVTGVSFMIGTLDFEAGDVTFSVSVVPYVAPPEDEEVTDESSEGESAEDETVSE